MKLQQSMTTEKLSADSWAASWLLLVPGARKSTRVGSPGFWGGPIQETPGFRHMAQAHLESPQPTEPAPSLPGTATAWCMQGSPHGTRVAHGVPPSSQRMAAGSFLRVSTGGVAACSPIRTPTRSSLHHTGAETKQEPAVLWSGVSRQAQAPP